MLAASVFVVAAAVYTRGSGHHQAMRASVDTIHAEALSTYTAMRPTIEAESVYLAAHPVVAFTRYVGTQRVSFPSGTVLDAPPGGVWTVAVGAADDPTDPTRQVNMLFAPSGALLRALPAQIPGIVSAGPTAPTASQLADLPWRDAHVQITEIPGPWCSGPACLTATGADARPPRRYRHARVRIETAALRGATVVAINGEHLKPNTPYYLESTAGTIGSAKTSPTGTIVAIMVIPADDVEKAETRGHGIAVLQGRGWEFIQACLYGGTVTNTGKYATCRGAPSAST